MVRGRYNPEDQIAGLPGFSKVGVTPYSLQSQSPDNQPHIPQLVVLQ